MTQHGGHVVAIGASRGVGLTAARLARHRGPEATSAGRSPETRLQAPRALEEMRTLVREIMDDGSVEEGVAALGRVGHGLLSAGTMRDGTMEPMTTLRHQD
jgi:NADPH:quinone reductase-like Zn-dependent oxidoreductase